MTYNLALILILPRLHDRRGDSLRRLARSIRPGNPPSRGPISPSKKFQGGVTRSAGVGFLELASKLSYMGERSEPRENARARGPSWLRCSLVRSREIRLARPNRRACSQARIFVKSNSHQVTLEKY